MTRPSFSVVVIARNEAKTLPVLAASIDPFLSAGGEFLVIDTGSDDDTVRVARQLGARVEIEASRFRSVLSAEQADAITAAFAKHGEAPLLEPGQVLFDFASARNFASALASHDHVWHIDASDVVESGDFTFLDDAVRSEGAHAFEYVLRLGSARFRVARFFDRRFYEWRGRVHEAPFAIGKPPYGTRASCTETQLLLRHLSQEKTRNYLAGLAMEAMEHPEMPRWHFYLGRELVYARKCRSALALLTKNVRAPHASIGERGESCCLMGICLESLGRPDAAAAAYLRGTRIDPSRRQPLLWLSTLCQKRGDFQGSIAFAAAAMTIPNTSPFINADEHYTTDPHAMMFWGLFWLGRRDEARVHWEACRKMAPENEKYREDGRLFGVASTRA